MKNKGLLIGVVALIVLGLFAYKKTKGEHKGKSAAQGAADKVLAFDINDVSRLDVIKGGATNRLSRAKTGWICESLYGYPVRFGKLSDELRTLAGMKPGQVMRGGTEYLHEFGLDPKGPAVPLQLHFGGPGGKLGTLYIGGSRQGAQGNTQNYRASEGTFVRFNEGPVLLVENRLQSFPSAATDWIDTDLPRVQQAEIIRITVALNGKAPYTVTRSAGGEHNLAPLNDTEEPETSRVEAITRALAYASFEAPADPTLDDAALGLDRPAVIEIETREGITYQLKLGKPLEDGNRPMRITASYRAPEVPVKPDSFGEGGEAAKAEAAYNRALQVHKEQVAAGGKKVKDLQARLGDWVYLVPAVTADNLLQPRSALITEKSAPEEESETGAAATPSGT